MADTVTITPITQTITVTPDGGTTTTITPAATQTVTITQSASISSAIDTTDSLAEGSTNLYFTNARASAAAPVQTLTMPTGYSVLDSSGDLTVTVTNAASVRTGIGANDASNLTTGDLASARVSTIPINSFSDVSISKTAGNIVYTDGLNVTARAPSNWNLSDFTNDIQIGDLNNVVTSGVADGDSLVYNSSTLQWEPGSPSVGSGTVTSVGLNVPGGFSVSGTNPITGSGTFEITSTLSGVIKGDGAATFTGDATLNDLSDVNFSTGAGNDGDLFYYDHAAGAGSKFKGIARSSISLSEFNDDLSYAASSHTHLIADVTDISAFAATILDDADAAAVRTTIGAAATNHNHSTSQITSGTFDDARIASTNVTQHAGDIDIQDLGNVVPGLLSDNLFLAYNNSTSNWTGRSPAAARTALGLGTAATSNTGDFAAASHTHTVSDITDLSDPVTSPSMTGVSAGSITGIIKCSQAQYDAITPVSTILYVIV